jgi:putative effector of murein hydrolase
LLLTGIPVENYQAGTSAISWLLTPATVCLALPLYQQLKVLKKNLGAIFAGIAAGTVVILVCVFLLCRLFRLEDSFTVSLLPKSITTAMGIVLSSQNGGIPSLTTAVIIVTGILGSLAGGALCKLLKLNDPISQGVAFGTASHVIGTSKAAELGQLQGAVSSLSLTVAGILTAVLFPLVCAFI